MDILDIGLLIRHQEKIRLFIFLEFSSHSVKNEVRVNLQKVLMAKIESNHKKLVLNVLNMLLHGKMQAVAVSLLLLPRHHAVISSNGLTVLMLRPGLSHQVSMRNIQFILTLVATLCGGCGMVLLVNGLSTSKLSCYQ